MRTAEAVYPASGDRPASWPAALIARTDPSCVPPPDDQWLAGSLRPVVNHGRWVVICDECGSAQVASRTDRRFWCVDCRPTGWRKVEWPPDDQVTQAEAALAARPDPRAQNWLPWAETVEALRDENAAHGEPTAPRGVRRKSGVTEYPCKQIPGNVWYEFKARGETVGHSGPPGLDLRLKQTETETGWTLTVMDGDKALSALAVGRAAERP